MVDGAFDIEVPIVPYVDVLFLSCVVINDVDLYGFIMREIISDAQRVLIKQRKFKVCEEFRQLVLV